MGKAESSFDESKSTNKISVQFRKRKSKDRYIFPSVPSKRYIYVHSMPRHEYQIGAVKLNIALVGRECGNFADATGIRLGRRNSTAHKWMRTVALFCGVRKVRLLCNTRWVVRTESFHCAIQESSKRLYHERLLCKAGSTKAALAVWVFVNRYLEMDSRAFFQWTEAEEEVLLASYYHVPRVLRLISKPGEWQYGPCENFP